jgi:hypothetical protein
LGDGFVRAAHGVLPVPAPATLKLLEGHPVRPGPEGAGELVTPTGAALVKVLSQGPPPERYVPLASGFGAGTKDPHGRANALRIVLAEAAPRAADGARAGGAAARAPGERAARPRIQRGREPRLTGQAGPRRAPGPDRRSADGALISLTSARNLRELPPATSGGVCVQEGRGGRPRSSPLR